jgi:hypothetical protein
VTAPIDTQLRDYTAHFDAELPQIDLEDVLNERVGRSLVRPLRPRRPRQRNWVVAAAAAIAVIVLVGAVGLLTRVSGDVQPATTPMPAPTTTAPTASTVLEPVPTTTADQAATGLQWAKSDLLFPEQGTPLVGGGPSTLISDGDLFFAIIGGELATSVDGYSWEAIAIENMPPPSLLGWEDADAASSKILLLDINGRQASTVLIDVAAGEAHESSLPFDPDGPVEDLRGFIALNDKSEAVAFLYDLRERSMGETPAFRSSDGINWSRIPAGQLPDGLALQIAALGDGFVATVGFDQPTSTYWHSPDGRIWTTAEADGTLPGSIVSWGDMAISYVDSAFGPQAFSANQAYLLTAQSGTELAVDLEPLEGGGSYGPVVAAGSVGIVAFAPVGPDPDGNGPDPEIWFVEYSPDGVVWVRQQLPFSSLNAFSAQAAAGADRVLVNVDGEIWVGTRP